MTPAERTRFYADMGAIRPCTNDVVAKRAEIRTYIEFSIKIDSPHRAAIEELYSHGAFRHLEDVAYAVIMLNRMSETVAEIERYLTEIAAGASHLCDAVFPLEAVRG